MESCHTRITGHAEISWIIVRAVFMEVSVVMNVCIVKDAHKLRLHC